VSKNIEDLYPLSPLQEGLLFQSLLAPEAGDYVGQQVSTLRGPLDLDALGAAWREVLDRHAVLRTSFAWKRTEKPLQVVHRRVELPLEIHDWRGAGGEERLAEFLRADRERGFDLARAPLVRISVLRREDDLTTVVWSSHHAILDGWSGPLVSREVFELYSAKLAGRAPRLGPVRPFRDYVRWLGRQDLAAAEPFWRGVLTGYRTALELPGEGGRGGASEARYGERARRVAELGRGAPQAALAAHRLTPATLVQGAWALVLARFSGRGDVVFGATVSSRPAELEGADSMIGLFLNTLPVRARLPAGDTRVAIWLGELQAAQVEARRFDFTPLVEIRKWSELPVKTPLFETLLAFENQPAELAGGEGGEAAEGGAVLTGVEMREQAHYPLTLIAEPAPASRLRLLHRLDRFGPAAAGRLLAHAEHAMSSLLGALDAPFAALPSLPPAERHQLLVEYADTATGFPHQATVVELFAAWAERTPEAVAVACGGRQLSYGELARRAAGLAERLRGLGVGPEVRVALSVERSPEMVVAILGVLGAGGAYVPLDPEYPPARLELMIADAGAALVVTQEHLAGSLPASAFGTHGPDPENLAYVMYTSGSTGRPKGVAVAHRSVVRLVRETGFARFGPEETFLQLAPISFDASTLELWGPLANGGRLAIFPPGPVGLDELGRVLGRERVSAAWLTSGLFHQMVEERPEGLDGLGQLLAGGDVLSPQHVARVLERRPGLALINGYGPTEGTTFSSCHRIEPGISPTEAIPIGRPIANTTVFVLDRALRPVPRSAIGQLAIGGVGLARGYLDRPRRTAEHFRPHPCAAWPGERVYLSGDLARWRADGTLAFLGRRDHQVKIRGFRVEPGEVERVIEGHPSVRAAVVAVRGEGAEDRRLVAYVVTAEGAGAELAPLRAELRSKLPEHLLPGAWVALDALPLDPNGKVDRRALPAPGAPGGGRATAAPEAPPESGFGLEALIADVFAEVLGRERLGLERLGRERLGLERLGPDDDFFELGGHSLLATRAASRLRQRLGLEIELRDLFENPTPAALASWLAARRLAAEGIEPPPPIRVEPQPEGEPAPLSFSQERLWFLDQMAVSSPVYNVPVGLHARGPLDLGALGATLGEIVRRHEVLRTRLPLDGDRPVQEVVAEWRPSLPRIDLSRLEGEACSGELRRRLDAEANRPFDLARGPLLRTALLILGREEHALALTMHHVVCDGWSMSVLIHEVGALYEAFRVGRPSPLAELPLQYADFARWQRRWLSGAVLEAQLAFWRERLEGVPPLELPGDRPAPPVLDFAGGACAVDLGAELAERLQRMARERGATLFMVLRAAVEALLYRHTGQTRFALGTPIAGRNRGEIEGLIGFFVNTLVLRADLSGGIGFADLSTRVRESTLDAFAHQDLPFEKLVAELEPERDPSRPPLFQVMFGVQNTPRDELSMGGLELARMAGRTRGARFPLGWMFEDPVALEGMGLRGAIEYQSSRFDATTALRLARRLPVLLAAALDRPERALGELPVLAEGERHQLLVEWRRGAPETAAALDLLPALVAGRSALAPEAIAVEFGARSLDYAALARRSARLARELRRLGVAPEVRVAVVAERSPEMLVACLAVLAAGGAYVPLDPEYPPERLAFMLADSGARLVLSAGSAARLPSVEGVPRLDVEALVARDAGAENGFPASGARGENLAVVVYTSGSTGRPKAVMASHRQLLEALAWRQATYPLGPGDGVVQAMSPSFDPALWELWGPLSAGARVVLPSSEEARDAPLLGELLRRSGASALQRPLPLLEELLLAGGLDGCADLRWVLVGGEPLTGPIQARFFEKSSAALENLYGPAEALLDVSRWSCRPGAGGEAIPIGRPIAGKPVVLVDRGLEAVPLGAVGELAVGGGGLARGYLGRPGATAERFCPDPFGETPGARLYRTGDLARYRADGNLEFLGRADGQVKIRGLRVELGEVQAALLRHPSVAEAVVAVDEDPRLGKTLAAWVVPVGRETSAAPDPAELRDFLRASLPEAMVPAVFIPLAALPLGPTGKLDRRALPRPVPSAERAAAPPRTPLEELLANLWAELLGLDSVGADDDFFALGGHSLLAARLRSRLREVLGVELPLRALFDTPTLGGLARSVEGRLEAGGEVPGPIAPRPAGVEAPLSLAQERLWLATRLESDNASYNLPTPLRLGGELDAEVLRRALGELVRRHEILRTRFPEVDGRPVQRVDEPAAAGLGRIDLRSLEPAARAPLARELAAREAYRPFDLARGPLLRTLLFHLGEEAGEERHLLLFVLHHIVGDGWSIGILTREVSALYEAFAAGRPSPLAELAVQYGDWAYWQRGWLRGETLRRHREFWRRELADPPPLALPGGRSRARVVGNRGGRQNFSFARELLERARGFAREEGMTLFMTLLAGFQLMIWRTTGQHDVLVATANAGRNRIEVERLIGFFISMVPLRLDLGGDPTFREAARRARSAVLAAFAHQEMPPDVALGELRLAFGLQTVDLGELQLGSAAIEVVPLEDELVRYDLSVWMLETPRGLEVSWTYRADLFEPETVAQLNRRFENLLTAALEHPDREAALLELSSAEEKARLESEKQRRETRARSRISSLKPKVIKAARPAEGEET